MSENIRFGSIPVFAGVLAFLPACNDGATQTSADSTSGATTTDTSDSSSTASSVSVGESSTSPDPTDPTNPTDPTDPTGVPECVTCSAEPEDGWFGPVVYARVAPGEAGPECPPAAPEPGPTLVNGFVDPGPAICECSCEAPPAQSCSAYAISTYEGYYGTEGYYGEVGGFIDYGGTDGGYYGGSDGGGYYGGTTGGGYYGGTSDGGYYGGNNCWGNYTQVSATCTNLTIDGQIRFRSYDDYYYGGGGGGACMKTEVAEIPVTEWAETITTCRLPDYTPGCEGGEVCIPEAPAGFEQKWCLYRDGDHECTTAEFPNKTTFWSGTDDTRDCTNCACGAVASACEEAELLVFGAPDCEGEPIAVLPAGGQCTEVPMGMSIAGDFGSEAACPVSSDSEPEGSVAPSGPFTFCCAD